MINELVNIYIHFSFAFDILLTQYKRKLRIVLKILVLLGTLGFISSDSLPPCCLPSGKMLPVFLELFRFIGHHRHAWSLLDIYCATKTCKFHHQVSHMIENSAWDKITSSIL